MSGQLNRIFRSEEPREKSEIQKAEEASVEIVSGGHAPTPPVQGAMAKGSAETCIGAGSLLEGRIVCAGPTRFSGTVNGEIVADGAVTVDESAEINANLNAKEAVISGRIVGNVSATGRISLAATARIDGDIQTPSLMIEEGAQVKGKIEVAPTTGDEATFVKPAPRFGASKADDAATATPEDFAETEDAPFPN